MVSTAVLGLGAGMALAFVLAPLVRSETDLEPLRRRRPDTRHPNSHCSVEAEILAPETRQCPHCGATVDTAFDFCGECASPLP